MNTLRYFVLACGVLLPHTAYAQVPATGATGDSLSGSFFTTVDDRAIATKAYPREGVLLGQGWDLFLNRKATGFCVDGKALEDDSAAAATISFSKIDDHEQIFDSLDIEASASYSGYGVSASAKLSFVKSLNVETDALNVLSKIKLDRKVIMMVPVAEDGKTISAGGFTLNSDAAMLLDLKTTSAAKNNGSLEDQKKEAYQKFRTRCGDAFVIGIRQGGELDAFMSFKMANQDAKQTLSASISGGGFGASVSAAMTAIHNDSTKHSSFGYTWYQAGDTPGATNPLTIDDFLGRFAKFGIDTNFGAIPYEIYILSYSQIEPELISKDLLPNNSYLNTLANHYWRLSDLYKQYDDIVQNSTNYYVSIFAPNGWPDIYTTQSWIWESSRVLDSELYACFQLGACSESENSNVVWQQLSLAADDPVRLAAAVLGSASTHNASDESSKNAILPALKDKMDALKAAGNPSLSMDDLGCTDYCLYYLWLASKPVSRTEMSDLWLLDYNPDKSIKAGVISTPRPAGAGPGPTAAELTNHADGEMRNWLLRNRLLPISDAFCQKALKHPLCTPPSRLVDIVSAVKLVFSAAPPAPPPPHPVTPPPYHDPCMGHPCK